MKQLSNRPSGRTLLVFCGIFALAIASAQATLVTWEFNSGGLNGPVGSSNLTFTSSGYSITAYGYDNAGGPPNNPRELYYKNEPPNTAGERGLGLVGTGSHELNVQDGNVLQYIQLDLSSILAQGFTNGQVQVTSLQEGESFRLFGSNSQGVLGLQLGGTFPGLTFDGQFVAVPDFGSYQFVSIAAATGRVLPVAFQADIVPIPEMNALFPIVGLFAAIFSTQFIRRRRLAKIKALLV